MLIYSVDEDPTPPKINHWQRMACGRLRSVRSADLLALSWLHPDEAGNRRLNAGSQWYLGYLGLGVALDPHQPPILRGANGTADNQQNRLPPRN